MDSFMHQSKLLLAVIAAFAACAAAGCANRYCCPPANTLLTKAEAESISGLGMELAYNIRESRRSSCRYNSRIGGELYSVVLTLHIFTEGGGPSNEAAHRQTAAKYGSVEDVSGVGDSSFLAALDDGELHLYARKKTVGFQLQAKSAAPTNEAREKLIAVARSVAARLE